MVGFFPTLLVTIINTNGGEKNKWKLTVNDVQGDSVRLGVGRWASEFSRVVHVGPLYWQGGHQLCAAFLRHLDAAARPRLSQPVEALAVQVPKHGRRLTATAKVNHAGQLDPTPLFHVDFLVVGALDASTSLCWQTNKGVNNTTTLRVSTTFWILAF